MFRRISSSLLGILAALLVALCGVSAPPAWAQSGSQGTVTVTVLDQSGGAVSGAQLQLQDLSTNDVRNAVTQDRGNYSFINLSVGTYKLTVSKTGFATQVFDSVLSQAAQVTDVAVTLKVAAAAGEKVEVVESATPLVETTSNGIGQTIDMKQIEDLPLQGRNVTALADLLPGTSMSQGNGATWNGLPSIAQGNNIDGVMGSTSRGKFGGNAQPAAQPRLENIQEMTVQTDQLDAGQGFGEASMQINFVTRRGTNSFHGRAYEDFRNSYLNANSWRNDALGVKKGTLKFNDFGGSIGGPILKNKLFFFFTYAEHKSPGTIFPTASILSQTAPMCPIAAGCSSASQLVSGPGAQAGNLTYLGNESTPLYHTVNVYTLAANCNATSGCATGLPTAPAAVILSQLAQINGVLPNGTLSTPDLTNDPSIQQLTWSVPAAQTQTYPTLRLDYNVSQAFRVNFAWNETKYPAQFSGPAFFPGAAFAGQATTFNNTYYTAAAGFDWTIRPTLINEFRGGFLYNKQNSTSSAGFNQAPTIFWGIGTTPQQYGLHTGQMYPLVNAEDTMTWQHGAHSVSFGASFYREQDHYDNPPGGIYGVNLGLASGDSAVNAFALGNLPSGAGAPQGEIESLYATLTGRITTAGTCLACGNFAGNGYNPSTGTFGSNTFNLDELQKAWGLFVQDSYRIRPSLTVNYSLRWDFTGDDHDLKQAYHGITNIGAIYGPSGVGNLFMPGVLNGDPTGGVIAAQEHQYKSWNVSPQPQVGLAWNPQFSQGFLGKLAGGGNTVIRAGFGIRRFTEPYQYFWDAAADQAFGFLQQFNIAPSTTVGTGNFTPGTLQLAAGPLVGSLVRAYLPSVPVPGVTAAAPCAAVPSGQQPCNSLAPGWNFVPATYLKSITESQYTFTAGQPQLKGIDPNIKQPYEESWNLGIERQLGAGNAIEIRYIGNKTNRQWISLNANEVNIFQPGNSFLNQFEQAQRNMALNNAAANATAYPAFKGTFAYDPAVTGEAATPVFDAAFAGEATLGGAGTPVKDYAYSGFIQDLNFGSVGSFASALTRTTGGQGRANFFCNLVGASFAPCGQTLGFTGAGAGYPINYFQVNPFYSGSSTYFMTSGGSSNYNALQIDFRQKQWHGMQFDANYTWSHNLGLETGDDWQGGISQLTLRNLDLGYGPTIYDLRQVVHVSGTYDLPFGKGKRFLAQNGLLDRAVGGWTVGTIFTFQTGFPFSLGGNGYTTFNNYASGGVILNGITRSQLQNAIGVYHVPGSACGGACVYVDTISPGLLSTNSSGTPLYGGLQNRNTNNAFAYSNESPGTLLTPIYLQGPHFWDDDLAITKVVPIRENLRFSLQGELLNAFNHPNFGLPNGSVGSGSFGRTNGPGGGARQIELRANLEF